MSSELETVAKVGGLFVGWQLGTLLKGAPLCCRRLAVNVAAVESVSLSHPRMKTLIAGRKA